MDRETRRALPARVPRAAKRRAGATTIDTTPLRVRVAGVDLADEDKQELRARLGRKLRRYAPHVTTVSVRVEDVNGPRGGIDTVCRIKLSVAGRGHVVVEERAVDAKTAVAKASSRAGTALSRMLDREGRTSPSERGKDAVRPGRARRAPPPRPPGGSLIGRRVGRSRANLLRAAARPEKLRRDAWTDTSLPGVSETDRKAGGGSTAARNTRLRTTRATATLEDSATKPSRKSTRKSANRQKSGSQQQRRQKRALHAPSSRARRA